MAEPEAKQWAWLRPYPHTFNPFDAIPDAVKGWRESIPPGMTDAGELSATVQKGAVAGGERMPIFGFDEETGLPLGHPDDYFVRVVGPILPAEAAACLCYSWDGPCDAHP